MLMATFGVGSILVGLGRQLCCLPGSVGDGGMFIATLSALRSRARLVAVTYPALSEPERLADGLAQVMNHLELASAVVVGSSFAAYWAQFFALRHPERVRALVLGNGLVDSTDLSYDPLFVPDYLESVSPKELHAAWIERVGNLPVSPLQQLQSFMLSDRQTPENLHARFLGVGRAKVCPSLSLPMAVVTVLIAVTIPSYRLLCVSGCGLATWVRDILVCPPAATTHIF